MRKIMLALFVFAACTDAGNTAIEIPFALFSSDELSASSTGACTVTPQTQAGGIFKASGLLEINPVLNPQAQYVLEVQVENYLSQQVLTDSSGNTVQGSNENDFHMEKATIKYIDIEQQLTGPAQDVALISGVVRPGGTQGATAVSIPAVGLNETLPWLNSFVTNSNLGPNATEDVVLEVQIFGVLGSGEQATSGLFHFPLQVCFGCKNIPLEAFDGGPDLGLYYEAGCQSGTTPVAAGHGPCCSPQDFAVFCSPCGAAGDACCGGPGGSCNSGGCTGMAPSGTEVCDLIPGYLTEANTCPITG